MTKQRTAIEQVLTSTAEHLTAEQIYLRARQLLPSLAVGTVYRNLNQMVREQKLRRLTIPGAADHFDRSTQPHGHLLCARCGRVCDCEVEGLHDFLEQKTGGSVYTYELVLCGLCRDCAENRD